MKKPALFAFEGVEFLELDVPAPRVAWKVRVHGEEFYVCVQVLDLPAPGDDILRELAAAAKGRRACRKAAQAAGRDAIGEEE